MFISENLGEINEKFASWKDHQPNYLSRYNEYDPMNNVIALLKYPDGTEIPKFGMNLIVDTGELYYMEEMMGAANTTDFGTSGRLILNNPASADTLVATDAYAQLLTPITASNKVLDGTYPKINDDDTANPGRASNVGTWRTTWTGADFDTEAANDITGGAIIATASPVGGTPLLNHWNFTTPFEKLSVASLIVWVNHTNVGA